MTEAVKRLGVSRKQLSGNRGALYIRLLYVLYIIH